MIWHIRYIYSFELRYRESDFQTRHMKEYMKIFKQNEHCVNPFLVSLNWEICFSVCVFKFQYFLPRINFLSLSLRKTWRDSLYALRLPLNRVYTSQLFFVNIYVRVSSFRLRSPTLDLMRLTISYTTLKTIIIKILCKTYGTVTEITNSNWSLILFWFITSCSNIFTPALSSSIRRMIFFVLG